MQRLIVSAASSPVGGAALLGPINGGMRGFVWAGTDHCRIAVGSFAKMGTQTTGRPSVNATTGAAIDRTALARALAKATAYAQCGKQREAEEWAASLVALLGCSDILRNPNPKGWDVVGTDHD